MYTKAIRNDLLNSYAQVKSLCARKFHNSHLTVTTLQASCASIILTTTRDPSSKPTSQAHNTWKLSSRLAQLSLSMLLPEIKYVPAYFPSFNFQ